MSNLADDVAKAIIAFSGALEAAGLHKQPVSVGLDKDSYNAVGTSVLASKIMVLKADGSMGAMIAGVEIVEVVDRRP